MKMMAIKFYRKAVRSGESEAGRTREAGKRARVCLCNLRERVRGGGEEGAAGGAPAVVPQEVERAPEG